MSDELLPVADLDSPEGRSWLEREVAASVLVVAQRQKSYKTGALMGLERQNPERAASILTALMLGASCRAVQKEYGCGIGTINRLMKDHGAILYQTKEWRTRKATSLRAKAAEALEKKLDDVLQDEEVRKKTSVKDLSLGYAITTDKERDVRGEGRVVEHRHRVTIADAQKAIEEARKQVAGKVIEVEGSEG